MNRWDNYTDTLGELCHSELFHAVKRGNSYRKDSKMRTFQSTNSPLDDSVAYASRGRQTKIANKNQNEISKGKVDDIIYTAEQTQKNRDNVGRNVRTKQKGTNVRDDQARVRRVMDHLWELHGYNEDYWIKGKDLSGPKAEIIYKNMVQAINDADLLYPGETETYKNVMINYINDYLSRGTSMNNYRGTHNSKANRAIRGEYEGKRGRSNFFWEK